MLDRFRLFLLEMRRLGGFRNQENPYAFQQALETAFGPSPMQFLGNWLRRILTGR